MNIPPLRLWMAPVALVVLGGVVFAAKSVAARSAAADAQSPAVEAAFTEAMRVRVEVGNLPASYFPDGKPVTRQMFQEAQAHVQQEMQDVLTGQALTQLEPIVDAAAPPNDWSKGFIWSKGFMVGGVDSMHFDQVSIKGTTAHVKAHFVAWAKLVHGPANIRVNPHNAMVSDATLVLQNGHWKVSNYLINFVNGGP